MDLISNAQQLKGWMPIRVKWNGPDPLIDWCRVDDARFTESFFDQTIDRMLQQPFNLMFRRRTGIDALEMAAAELESIKPSGFIFHLSRCGSTLVSKMLATLPQNVVISEASPLDKMIRSNVFRPDMTDDERVLWIRWMVASMAQRRFADAEHFFIKFDAWHMLYFELIEQAFPDVPWIFLYRDPAEVLVSHVKQREAGTIPGIIDHRIEGLTIHDTLSGPLEEYPARVLGRICESALKYRDRLNGSLVNYTRLPGFTTTGLLRHFGLEYSADEIAKMNAAAKQNAKFPGLAFVPDSKVKQSQASDEIRFFAAKYVLPLYERLEAAAAEQQDMADG